MENKIFRKEDYTNLAYTLKESEIGDVTGQTRIYVQEEREKDDSKVRI